MQLKYHSPLGPSTPEPTYHPIFYRVKERLPGSPISPMSEFPPDIEWETRFVKCSYAMVSSSNLDRSKCVTDDSLRTTTPTRPSPISCSSNPSSPFSLQSSSWLFCPFALSWYSQCLYTYAYFVVGVDGKLG
jgi:hypothetical protein